MNQATTNVNNGNPAKGEELDAFTNKGNGDKTPVELDPLADNTVDDDDKDNALTPTQNPFRPDLPFEQMKQNIE